MKGEGINSDDRRHHREHRDRKEKNIGDSNSESRRKRSRPSTIKPDQIDSVGVEAEHYDSLAKKIHNEKEGVNSVDHPVNNKKYEPNYKSSGLLAKEANSYNGIALKYSEPREARKPKRIFRLYAFKGEKQVDVLRIHRHSAYLIGRERRVADIPIDHPSCSSQHAVIQYRNVQRNDSEGNPQAVIIPYIIDLNSTNGTCLNSEKIEPSRYYELKSGDTFKFGFSTRVYVIIAEDSIE